MKDTIVVSGRKDPTQINGLIAEDRIRTTKMFLRGNVAFHPTHVIDISETADLIQGIPTHVKIKQKKKNKLGKYAPFSRADNYSIDMACAYRFWQLVGDHRLLIMFYVIETHTDLDGKDFEVMRFDEVVEIILTEVTFKRLRGSVSRQEMGRLKGNILAWKPSAITKEDANDLTKRAADRFHPITEGMRKRTNCGLARPSVHINMKLADDKKSYQADNKRVQSAINTNELIAQVESEDAGDGVGKYRNHAMPSSRLQDRVIVYDKAFYGLKLPWRTRASTIKPAKGWEKLAETGNIVPLIENPPQLIPEGQKAKYVMQWKAAWNGEIPGGEITILRHDDDMRTIYLETQIKTVRKNFEWACEQVGAEHIVEANCWLMSLSQGKTIKAAFTKQPLPVVPTETVLEANANRPNVFKIKIGNRCYFAMQFGNNNENRTGKEDWSIWQGAFSGQDKEFLERRMSCALFATGLTLGATPMLRQKNFNGNENWLFPGTDPDMIESVAKALIDYTHFD